MAAAVGVILVLLAGAVCLYRYRRGAVYPFSRRRKDSSISYSQQKDEVSAAAVFGDDKGNWLPKYNNQKKD